MLKKEGLKSSSDNLDPSWRDILLNVSEDDEENDIINIWSQPIWFTYNTKRKDIIEIIFIMVYYLLMVLSEDKHSFVISDISKQVYNRHKLPRNICYCRCRPKGMETNISQYGRVHDIKNDIVDRLKPDKKQCNILINCILNRGIYNLFASNYISMVTLSMIVLPFVLWCVHNWSE